MKEITQDLLAEYQELDQLCQSLTMSQWQTRSNFYGWTPWDEIAHLCYFDETGLQSAHTPEEFTRDLSILTKRLEQGQEISAIARECYISLDGPALLQHWRSRYESLVSALAALDPKERLAWYGPSMSARSFASARIMETWAHGQDIWDVVGRVRPASARLYHIAHLGVTTFKWTFVNRKLQVPERLPRVELRAPDGTTWCWNEASSDQFVKGSAVDFCLLVTQRRHLLDTDLMYSGEGVRKWLPMAQCFAGPPAEGVPAGQQGRRT
ncbi:TIGR03084 family metal-binding protein [Limnohabitans sp. 2KL-51]|uniref:TIGR03084 family metal-binding protein n=1 Tax=Limnohabitans sp. 2KL-51 TaxID=1977911 RepID=UPI000D34A9B8|nr:TIGR03084 family metal-binding protein [Limnohabitans sp. 2KL-51]PUE48599.1 TIGR03084 family protein [Limnohabitans sp. 2KL-51]